MKRLLNSAVILIGLTLIAGCTMEPDAPRLISPKDGSVFDTVPPTFTWSPEENAEGYLLEVIDDTNGLDEIAWELDHLWQYTNGTTYTLRKDEFDKFGNFTYYWHVASFWLEKRDTLYAWSEWRSFVVNSPPSIAHGDIDLDTTYYPYGLGYIWYYETSNRNDYYYGWYKYGNAYTIVTDSFWVYDTLVFETNGSGYVKFWKNTINGNDLYPEPESTSTETEYTLVKYIGDSLLVKGRKSWPPNEYYPINSSWEHRLKGVGLISVGNDTWDQPYSSGNETKLLWFYNGKDTVYKAPD